MCVSRDTYLITAWSRALLEKLTGSAASQEIPHIFGTRRFVTVLTSARHLSLSWANSIHSSQPLPLPEDYYPPIYVWISPVVCFTWYLDQLWSFSTNRSFPTTLSQLKICDFFFQERLLKVLKCHNFLWVQRRHNLSPAASVANCVMKLYLLEVHLQTFLSIQITQKCQIF